MSSVHRVVITWLIGIEVYVLLESKHMLFILCVQGLFARRRMFLLTEGPRFFYVDPQAMVLKGEIPW